MSVTMFIAAMAGPRLAAGLAPKRVAQVGLLALAVASVRPARRRSTSSSNETTFALALALFGVGAGPAALPARQRDHVVGRPGQDQRGRRPAGHRAEPRRVARHGADRLGADRGAHERVHRARRAEPGGPAAGRASRSPSSPRRAFPSCRSTTSSRRRSTKRAAGRPGRRRSPTTTATPQLHGLKRAIGAVGDLRAALAVVHPATPGPRGAGAAPAAGSAELDARIAPERVRGRAEGSMVNVS